jgi:hypothetical protein
MENKVTYCREVSKPVSAGFCLFVWLVGFLFVCLFVCFWQYWGLDSRTHAC